MGWNKCLSLYPLLFLFTLSFTHHRPEARSLDGEWSFCATAPIHDVVANRQGSFDPPPLYPSLDEVIPLEARQAPGDLLPEDASWLPITVPCAWEQVAGIDFNGAAWYRRELFIPADWLSEDSCIWIEFDAVATAAGVWLNGQWVGGHLGDYARWRVDASAAAKEGANDLQVYVDELPGHIHQGFLSALAPHHGGIWQEVRIYRTAQTRVVPDGVHCLADCDTGRVTIRVELEGAWDGERCRADLAVIPRTPVMGVDGVTSGHLEVDFRQRAEFLGWKEESRTMTFGLKVDQPRIWSTETPNLYTAELTLRTRTGNGRDVEETFRQTFAFRTVEIRGSEIFLNGKRLNVRSVLNWGVYPRQVSPAPPRHVVREEFAYYKRLGFNCETLCLVVLPDYFYDMADSMGMLLWEEYPTWHNVFTEAELPTHLRQFPCYLRRDRNHPSVILRSVSVEAGVKNQEVMKTLVDLVKEMTDTPVQDNSSWFWLSNEALTEWYGEDNYWNNDRWARHTLIDLPRKLDEMPAKPYLPGETMAGTIWPDVEALAEVEHEKPLPCGLLGCDDAQGSGAHPYWFPTCFESCRKMNAKLRARYNPILPEGEDIIRDYLMPESKAYSLAFRQFQISLLYADPRYAGWTFFLGWDVSKCHSGLYDHVGRPRWTPEDFAWLGDHTKAPVLAADVAKRDQSLPLIEAAHELRQGIHYWADQGDWAKDEAFAYLRGGYSDLGALAGDMEHARRIDEKEIGTLAVGEVLLTNVVTHAMVEFLEGGGRVVLLTSRWPGAFSSRPHMFWTDAVFAPPVDASLGMSRQELYDLHLFDLTHTKAEAIPSADLGMADQVDPLLRLFQIHDLVEVSVHDALVATRVGEGLLVASALDHSTGAGKWCLNRLIAWAKSWNGAEPHRFPITRLPGEKAMALAVGKTRTLMMLNHAWRFRTDPEQQGETLGWQDPDFDDTGWARLPAASMWESHGYHYDGMAWYRRKLPIDKNDQGAKVTLVAEGVDDAYRLWINGKPAALHGSFTVHEETVFQKRTETDITDFVIFGKENSIVLQVVDVFGAGGINGSIYCTIE